MEPDVVFPEKWSPPPELARALPREVRMTGVGVFISAVLMCLLAGSMFLLFFLRSQRAKELSEIAILRTEGLETPGEVVKLWRSGKNGTTPMVTYEFSKNGRRYSGESEAPSSIWQDLRLNGSLQVRYSPTNPTINHPAGWDTPPMPGWVPYILALTILLCVTPLAFGVRRESALLSDGLPAPGVVTRTRSVKGGWAAHYLFRAKDGTVTKGRSKVARNYPPGSVICILYDPERPRRNEAYPIIWYRVANS